MTTGAERREFFRIKDRIEIEFRGIDQIEFLRLEHLIKYNPTQVVLNPQLSEAKRKKSKDVSDRDALTSLIGTLDRKLSMIIDLLTKTGRDDLYTKRYVEVDISGSGLSFVSDVPMAENGHAELRLLIPVFPYPKIPVLCRVVRAQKRDSDSPADWEIACKFLTINDADRDLLIQYIFAREREQIRSRKGFEGR
jgi:hypothetical protein